MVIFWRLWRRSTRLVQRPVDVLGTQWCFWNKESCLKIGWSWLSTPVPVPSILTNCVSWWVWRKHRNPSTPPLTHKCWKWCKVLNLEVNKLVPTVVQLAFCFTILWHGAMSVDDQECCSINEQTYIESLDWTSTFGSVPVGLRRLWVDDALSKWFWWFWLPFEGIYRFRLGFKPSHT